MLVKKIKQSNNIGYKKFIEKSYENSYDFEKYIKVENPKIKYYYTSILVPRQYDGVSFITHKTYKEDYLTKHFMTLYMLHHEAAILKLCGGEYIDHSLINAARHIEIYFDNKSILFEKLSLKKSLFLAHWLAYLNKTQVTLSSYSREVYTINIIYDKISKTFEYKYNSELEIKY